MKVDVTFSTGKVYNIAPSGIGYIDIKTGESFLLETDGDGSEDWFSSNDPVLDITVDGKSGSVKAASGGESIIRIMNSYNQIVVQLNINSKNIIQSATDLGLSSDTPQPK